MKILVSVFVFITFFSTNAQDILKYSFTESLELNKLYNKVLTDNSEYITSFEWNHILTNISNIDLKKIDSYKNYYFLTYENLKKHLIENNLSVLNYLELSHKIISKDTIDINIKPKSVILLKKKRKDRKIKTDKFHLSFSGCGLLVFNKPDYRFVFEKKIKKWMPIIKR